MSRQAHGLSSVQLSTDTKPGLARIDECCEEKSMQSREHKLHISNACLFNSEILSTSVLTLCTQFQMDLIGNTPFSLLTAFEAKYVG